MCLAGGTDQNGRAAGAFHGLETVLVGDIVAKEDRAMTEERRQIQQLSDGGSLVDTGHPKLDHIVTVLQMQIVIIGQLPRQIVSRVAHARRSPVMQRRAQGLVFEQQAFGGIGEDGELLLDGIQPCRAGQVFALSVGKSPFRTVASRCRQPEHAKTVEHLDCAAADQGQSPVEPVAQRMKGFDERFRHLHCVRAIAQFDKCSVEIEKQGIGAKIQ